MEIDGEHHAHEMHNLILVSFDRQFEQKSVNQRKSKVEGPNIKKIIDGV